MGKKLILFHRGAEAARRVSGVSGLYFCPICQNGYNVSAIASGDLTLEHVPPASVGGRGIALTCRTCNSTAGHTVDAEVHRRDQMGRFVDLILRGVGDRPHAAVLRIGGEVANVQVAREESGHTVIRLKPDNNNPAVLERISQHMEAMNGLGGELNVRSRIRYHRRRAEVGELRSAFLAAFAMFGYRYAFHPYLEDVRKQILQPNAEIISGWILVPAKTSSQRVIMRVTEPRALFVQIGTRGVLLPSPDGPSDLYAQLRKNHERGELINLGWQSMGWPQTLEMRADFFEDPEAQPAS